MSKLEILSVAEADGRSDCMVAQQKRHGTYGNPDIFTISINVNRHIDLTISRHGPGLASKIVWPDFDIDGMIEYLQAAKEFISEEAMVEKLKGRMR